MRKFGIQLQTGPFSKIREQAVLADMLGFDDVWYPDHLQGGSPSTQWHELFITLSMIALNTERVGIASGVTDTLRRSPFVIAQGFASLDQLSNGRAIVGLGAGEKMNLLRLPTQKPVKTLGENIMIIKEAWKSLGVKPVHDIPIYIGGFGPKMINLMKTYANGWLPFSLTPAEYLSYRKTYNFAPTLDLALLPVTLIYQDGEKAKTDVLKSAQKYRVITKYLGLFNWKNTKEEYDSISKDAEKIPQSEALSSVLAGNVDDIIKQAERFIKVGCRHIVFGIQNPDCLNAIKMLAEVKASF